MDGFNHCDEWFRSFSSDVFRYCFGNRIGRAVSAVNMQRALWPHRGTTVVMCLALQVAAVYLPLLQKVLHTVPPTVSDWGVIAACSLMPVAAYERGCRHSNGW